MNDGSYKKFYRDFYVLEKVQHPLLSALFFLQCQYFLQVCESFNLDHLEQDKRGYRDADDPRNLFAAMYGGVYKRSDPYELDFR